MVAGASRGSAEFPYGPRPIRTIAIELTESVLEKAQAHEPATFAFDRKPLNEPLAELEAPVNRERLYDFYTKQANHFRVQDRDQRLLMEYPGLDGGAFGHWGIQNETTWASDDWNSAILDRVQCVCVSR